jgi:hypothetical protein
MDAKEFWDSLIPPTIELAMCGCSSPSKPAECVPVRQEMVWFWRATCKSCGWEYDCQPGGGYAQRLARDGYILPND